MAQPYLVRNGHLGYNSSKHNPNYFQMDQLYNINDDPREQDNLAEENPEKLAEMKQLLSRYLKTFPDHPFGEFTK